RELTGRGRDERRHRAAERAGQLQSVGPVVHPGTLRCGVLAEAVPGRRLRRRAVGQQLQGDHAGQEDRRLGDLGRAQRLDGRLEAQPGQLEPEDPVGHPVVPFEQVGTLRYQVTAHAGALGALAGKQEGGTWHRCSSVVRQDTLYMRPLWKASGRSAYSLTARSSTSPMKMTWSPASTERTSVQSR